MKLTPGWVLLQVNFDFLQEIGPKLGGGGALSQDYSNSKQALTSIAPHLQVELQFSILLLSVDVIPYILDPPI